MLRTLLVAVSLSFVACAPGGDVESPGASGLEGLSPPLSFPPVDETGTSGPGDSGSRPEKPAELLTGRDSFASVCARGNTDAVARALCREPTPDLTSLTALQKAVGFTFDPAQENGRGGNPGFALTTHSTSLVIRSVSTLNPRAILFTPRTPRPNPDLVMMGFARGEQFVELVARSASGELNFYLLEFEQACNARGCTPAELLTPAIEKDWTRVSLYTDEDLRGTVLDCNVCHQPQGPGTPKLLRMQEFANPWMHWMRSTGTEARKLLLRFQEAHAGNEDYAGIPGAMIPQGDPFLLEGLLRGEEQDRQPNVFPSLVIERERLANPDATPTTWLKVYDVFARGDGIAVPDFRASITDRVGEQAAGRTYRDVVAGTLPPEALEDFGGLVLPESERNTGVRPQLDATGEQALVAMCQRCHNSRLDPTLSRANFNVQTLASMSRQEKDAAIWRLQRPSGDRFKMPPERFGAPDAAEVERMVEVLRR